MRGKHSAPKRKRRLLTVAVAALVCVALGSAGLTLAWYTGASSILNIFAKGTIDVAVEETFEPAVGKNDVKVSVPTNEDAMPVYVRAQVDVYWQDAQGTRMWDAPVEKSSVQTDPAQTKEYDYEMTWCSFGQAGSENAWVVGADGFYYWTSPVEPGQKTDPLIVSCTQKVRYSDGRVLVVDVATQAVQSDPARAFNESWGPHAGLQAADSGVLTAAA